MEYEIRGANHHGTDLDGIPVTHECITDIHFDYSRPIPNNAPEWRLRENDERMREEAKLLFRLITTELPGGVYEHLKNLMKEWDEGKVEVI